MLINSYKITKVYAEKTNDLSRNQDELDGPSKIGKACNPSITPENSTEDLIELCDNHPHKDMPY